MLETLAYNLDRGVRALAEIFGSPVGSYCRLETVHNDVLVADDGSLLTVLRLEGSLVQVGVEEYRQIVEGLTEKLQSSLSREGHLLQVVFEYDPEASGERRCSRPRGRRRILWVCTLAACWTTTGKPCGSTALWRIAGWCCGHARQF